MKTKVLITCAMFEEAKEIISAFNLLPVIRTNNIYTNKNETIYLLITGIGIINSVFYVTKFLETTNITRLINIGYAGGYRVKTHSAYQIKNIYLADANHTQVLSYPKYTLPGVNTYALKPILSLPCADLYTSSTFQTIPLAPNLSYVADMEGYSHYFICSQYNIELVMIKYVTDIIGSARQAFDYDEAEKSSAKCLAEILLTNKEVLFTCME